MTDSSYPVVPEVGKIGRSDGSYILPVAERKDGIKSFFMKQSPKKAPADDKPPPKPITKAHLFGNAAKEEQEEKPPDVKEEDKPSVEEEKAGKEEAKVNETDEEAVKQDATAKPTQPDTKPVPEVIDVDDEPEPSSQSSTSQKRKREDKRGGRQTKIVRPSPKEEAGQKPITSFFKSPKK